MAYPIQDKTIDDALELLITEGFEGMADVTSYVHAEIKAGKL